MTNRVEYLTHALLFSLGLLISITGFLMATRLETLFVSIGTSIAATALAAGLIRAFLGAPLEPVVAKLDQVFGLSQSAETTGLVKIYTNRTDIPGEQWRTLFREAQQDIAVLGYAVHFLTEDHEVGTILRAKAAQGCRVRICLGDPHSPAVEERTREEATEGAIAERIATALARWTPLISSGVEIRLQSAPLYASIYIGDSEMIVTPQVFGVRASRAPAIHFRHPGSLYEKYRAHFDTIWEGSRPWSS